MNSIPIDGTFASWRTAARVLIGHKIPPDDVSWHQTPRTAEQDSRFLGINFSVSKVFIDAASWACFYRADDRWDLLYRILWRMQFEDKSMMMNLTDDDVMRLQRRSKAVHRDTHKMKAFVRFKQVDENAYVAWHNPDHFITRLAAPFFKRRFTIMKWSILTPDESMHWDGKNLVFSEGVPDDPCLKDDFETYWLTYYAHIFNPARIKIKAMKKEMPVRHWKTLPETKLIESMLEQAPKRVEQMLTWQPPSPEKYIRDYLTQNSTLEDLKNLAKKCTYCPLYQNATQTVFGDGPHNAKIVIIGEQPGDREDSEGRPFVGPSGDLLNRALNLLNVNREEIYVTNAVKHFKWKPGEGKKRLHQSPEAREIAACKSWLDHELEFIKPELIICLGVTAAQAILGKVIKISDVRSKILTCRHSQKLLITMHPSAILRAGSSQEKFFDDFVEDLKLAFSEKTK